MRKDLQAQNLRVNEEKTLNIQLQEKLALITEEVKQLRKSEIAMTSSVRAFYSTLYHI